ncbi:MAG: hypothetical protein ABFS14_04020 [Gemmatimonadota bacterium]
MGEQGGFWNGQKRSMAVVAGTLALLASPQTLPGQDAGIELVVTGEAEVLAPGVVSLPESNDEYLSFSPDMTHAVFTRRARRVTQLYETRWQGDGWTEPSLVPFSGDFSDNRGSFSPDGSRLFFSSNRPVSSGADRSDNLDIWVVDLDPSGWAEPRRLGPAVNGDQNDTHPSVASSGNLYFVRWGDTETDIYVSEWTGGGYAAASALSEINTEGPDSHPNIDPGERFLVFTPTNREDGFGGGDIYVSYPTDSGWSPGRNLGPPVNTDYYEYSARVTPDGRLSFSRAGFGEPERRPADVYIVDLEIRTTGR